MSKLAALLAYDAGLLSDEGARRVERALARSAQVRRELASARAAAAVLGEVGPAPVDWPRLDVGLAAALAAEQTFGEARAATAIPPLDLTRLEASLPRAIATARATDALLGELGVATSVPSSIPSFDADRLEARLMAALATSGAPAQDAREAGHADAAPASEVLPTGRSALARIEGGGARRPAADAKEAIAWRALLAYAEDTLSADGRRRVEAKLARSAAHRDALARVRALARASAEAIVAPTPDVSSVELPLRREVRRIAARRRMTRVGLATACLAAAAALLLLMTRGAPEPEPVATRPTPVAPPAPTFVAEARALDAEVTAIAGAAFAEGVDDPLGLGDRLLEGSVIRVRGALHGRLAEGTGLVLDGGPTEAPRRRARPMVDEAPEAALRLERLREDRVELALLAGRVSNEVRHGTRYVVHAGPYVIEVRGTRFAVRREGDVVSVQVDAGTVAVLEGDEEIALLEAPATWRSHPEAADAGAAERPRAASADAPWPALRLPASRFVWVELDGTALPAAGGLAMRAPPGEHELVAFDDRGLRHRATVTLRDEGQTLDERELVPERLSPRRGYLPPEVIQGVVQPRVSALRRCYERSLRRTSPDLEGSYTLRVQVGADGSVRGVRVITNGETPPPFVRCLELEAETWVFPRPEGDAALSFDLPLAFAARGI